MTDIVEEMAKALHAQEWTGQPRPDSFESERAYWMASAQAAYTIVERRIGELAVKALSYDHAHEDAVEMGYPSLTEALEHLEELRK
jgi:hypothetical protein